MTRITILAALLIVACGGDKSDDTGTLNVTTTPSTTDTGPFTTEPTTSTTTTPTTTTTTGPQAIDFCPPWAAATGTVISVGPGDVATLQATLDGLSSGDTLELQDGTYDTSGLSITVPGVTLRSASGDRDAVILDGNDSAPFVLGLFANDLTVADLTVRDAYSNGILVRSTSASSVTGANVYNVVATDNLVRGISIEPFANGFADDGTIACSRIELTDTGRTRTRNLCDVGGIEAREAMGWTLRDNILEGFWCDSGTGQPAIAAWRGSRDTQILRNAVQDSARGISLGMTQEVLARSHDDLPCTGALAQHFGGSVINNTVWAYRAELFNSLSTVAFGIAMDSACDALVLHNSVYIDAPPTVAAIIHRYSTTSGSVQNNLVSHTVQRTDDATSSAIPNLENEPGTSFQQITSGDMHLAPGAINPIDSATDIWLTLVPDDFEGIPRDATPDFGADER